MFAFAVPLTHRAFSLWPGLRNVLEGGAESVFLRAQKMWLIAKTKTHPGVVQVFINRSLPGMKVAVEAGRSPFSSARLIQGPPLPRSLPCFSPLDLNLLSPLSSTFLMWICISCHTRFTSLHPDYTISYLSMGVCFFLCEQGPSLFMTF